MMKQFFSCYSKAIAIITTIFTMFLFTKTNAQWSEVGGLNSLAANNQILSISTDKAGNVYAGGYFTNASGNIYVAKWDGKTWSELGGKNSFTGVNNGIGISRIHSIASDASGNIYVAGGFHYGSATPNKNGNYYDTSFVIKWNGNNWSKLQLVTPYNGSTLITIKSIAIDAAGNLYGNGTYSKGTSDYLFVAKWTGSSWQELKGDTSYPYYLGQGSITTDAAGNVYAGATSNPNSGIQDSGFVVKWNGTTWSTMGSIKYDNCSIESLTTDNNGNVYAGAQYYTGSNVNLIKYTANSSTVLNNIVASPVTYGVASDISGSIYVSGIIKNYSYYNVAKYDGAVWSVLGDTKSINANGNIMALATDANGNVYAAGSFTNASNKYYVAEYTPTGLPVKLANINTIQENKDIAINWHTATELNTSHFIIQHNTEGSSFTDIGTVKAIGSGANSYSFTDTHPANGTNYYRLESVDKDGAVTYSKVVSIQLTIDNYKLSIIPNPARDVVTVKGNNIASVQVIDNIGRVVKVVNLKDATNPTLSVGGLKAGVYHLRVQTTDGKVSGASLVVSY